MELQSWRFLLISNFVWTIELCFVWCLVQFLSGLRELEDQSKMFQHCYMVVNPEYHTIAICKFLNNFRCSACKDSSDYIGGIRYCMLKFRAIEVMLFNCLLWWVGCIICMSETRILQFAFFSELKAVGGQ